MSLTATFLDKIKYVSNDFRARDADFIGNGLVSTSHFPISYPTPASMSVTIGSTSITSVAWCGYAFRVTDNATQTTLTFATANTTNPRIDIIEIGVNATTDANNDTTGTPVIQIKQGVAASSPVEPGADPGFVKLYAVNIAANQTSISSANVIDRRALVPLNIDGSQITNTSGLQTSAFQSFLSDLIGNTSVVLSGGVATKDGTVANQLDVTAADVYFATGQHVNFAASYNGQFITSTVSTTYYLDYNTDGTTSFTTTHSTKTGYITICSVATDASGNISTVTDARQLTINLFGGSTDTVKVAGNVQAQKFIGDGSQLTNLPTPALPTDVAKTDVAQIWTAIQTYASSVGTDSAFGIENYSAALGASWNNQNLGGTQYQLNGAQEAADVIHVNTNSSSTLTNYIRQWYSYALSAAVFAVDFITGKVSTKNVTVDDGNGNLTATTVKTSGLTGATAASRYVGATTGGAPTSGTFAVGDFVIDQTGKIFVCTTAGSPGTWVAPGGSTVASARNMQITGTSAQQIFTFTPAASGIYRLTLYIRDITGSTNVTATLSFADSGGAQTYIPSTVNNSSITTGSHGVIDYTFEAVTGTNIVLNVTAGTANQVYITSALEKVA